MFVFMSVVVTVGLCENVSCVAVVVEYSGVLSRGVLKYGVGLYSGCDGC